MQLDLIQPSDISFKELLSRSQFAVVYLETIHGEACVMKVVRFRPIDLDHNATVSHIQFILISVHIAP